MASCTSDTEETTATTGKSNVQLVVGEFPAFGDSQTRAIGTPDLGKTSWESGDELLLLIDNTSYGSHSATFTYNGKSWELTSGELVYREGDPAYIPHVYYAPNYKWANNTLMLKDGKVAGTDEYIEGIARITNDGSTIAVTFSNAARDYSRLRIATIPNKPITVVAEYFTPAGSSDQILWEEDYSLTSDNNGNVFLYGNFDYNSTVTVKYVEAPLANYTFSKTTEKAKSYVLDATVVSLADEAITYEQIADAVKKEFDAGKTYINLILSPDADENTLDAIHYGLAEAGYWSINLTLIGCKKIPSRGFMSWTMLKSIALPDVTVIEENAFLGCTGLQKVVLGNLTKVYGNVRKNGIFDGCSTKAIDLVLSKDQKVMNGGETEDARYCWTADIIKDYAGSDEHYSKKFLGYEFKSITCSYRVE